ncbi:class I SAM-dependent rRNA methyltransferase [Denitrificimonas sp. JX-1]|uniref:Class I SAM-dependent rRNA methyltransferase n=1 Tax=Denitrificimonas halotolerans TaxID=3098930 RepID=A0ABU5GNJ8_9GAMM|nr:class I SAM-dependent rRNA methyltransferase [Denitrificimonas sp. JX-1]MDY7218429.1 class I SAM-dependent rRNA methyltransferase [Denitrificimonas sp. JX-1]
MPLPSLRLKSNADRRLRSGHLWIYSNEIDTKQTPLNRFQTGDQAIVENASGKPLGVVILSPQALICARLVSRDIEHRLDKSLLVHRLNIALSLRERLFDAPFYRLIHAEGDLLPGLEVDRFGDILVVQISAACMEPHKDIILEALLQVCKPTGVLWRNDAPTRDLEGLERYLEVAYGEVPEWVQLLENNLTYNTPILQKKVIGWHYDQRFNRMQATQYCINNRVLSVYSGAGSWAIPAALAGASEVLCADASGQALDALESNAQLNEIGATLLCAEGDVLETLESLKADEERFDVIIADPPAFIKRKKDIKSGEAGYRKLYEHCIRLLSRDGIFICSSRSPFFTEESMHSTLLAAARHLDRNIQILEQSGQSADHPMHPAIPETRYLKYTVCRILPNS